MSNGPSIVGVAASPAGPGQLVYATLPPSNSCPEKDEYPCKEEDRGKEYFESFSKRILRLRFDEYEAGKLTKRYMESYLEFLHLSGYISNLDYLEFRNILKEDKV